MASDHGVGGSNPSGRAIVVKVLASFCEPASALRVCPVLGLPLVSCSEHEHGIRPWPTGVYLMCAHSIGFFAEATTRKRVRQPLAERPADRCNGSGLSRDRQQRGSRTDSRLSPDRIE